MSLIAAMVGTMKRIGAVTIDSNWGSQGGASPQAATNKTCTVPAGNPGSLNLDIAGETAPDLEYRIDSGTYTSFTTGQDISVTNGQTLNFRATGAAATSAVVTVTDNLRGDAVGTWDVTIE